LVSQDLSISTLTSGAAKLSITGGNFRVQGNTFNDGLIVQHGGVASFGASVTGAGSIDLSLGGIMICGIVRQDAVHISNGNISGTLGPAGNNRVSSLVIDEVANVVNGGWDVDDGALIIDYPGASPLPAIQRYLVAGYANGDWNSLHGIRSLAAAENPDRNTALGYAEAAELLGAGGGTFKNESVDGSAIFIDYTIYGDANLDRAVDSVDFNLLAADFGAGSATWNRGDIN
jgi:hypothetical protein